MEKKFFRRDETAAAVAEAYKEQKAEEDRERDILARKQRMRDMATERKLGERMRRLVPGFKDSGSAFKPL